MMVKFFCAFCVSLRLQFYLIRPYRNAIGRASEAAVTEFLHRLISGSNCFGPRGKNFVRAQTPVVFDTTADDERSRRASHRCGTAPRAGRRRYTRSPWDSPATRSAPLAARELPATIR